MSLDPCCAKGFEWDGTPEGKEVEFPTASNQAYVVGSNSDVAIMLTADLFGWRYPNIRLLADHFAKETPATVYVPDFFGDESLDTKLLEENRLGEVGLPTFISRNSREIREPEIFACAKKLRSEYRKVGAIGYCYGGWVCFRLGAEGQNMVDCVVPGHPSLLTKEDINGYGRGVPIQVQAPEMDAAYTPELKELTWKIMMEKGVQFDYQHFPGVEHACLTRGSPKVDKEREAMVRGKNAAVSWFRQWLHDS